MNPKFQCKRMWNVLVESQHFHLHNISPAHIQKHQISKIWCAPHWMVLKKSFSPHFLNLGKLTKENKIVSQTFTFSPQVWTEDFTCVWKMCSEFSDTWSWVGGYDFSRCFFVFLCCAFLQCRILALKRAQHSMSPFSFAICDNRSFRFVVLNQAYLSYFALCWVSEHQ